MDIDSNIDNVFKKIKALNGNSSDIVTRIIKKHNKRIG